MGTSRILFLVLAGGFLPGAAAMPAAAGEPFTPDHHRRVDRIHDRYVVHRDHVGRYDERIVHVNRINDRSHANADRVNGTRQAAGHGRHDLYVLGVEVDHKLLDKGKKDPDTREAVEFARVLRENARPLYREVHTRVLTGKRADRAGILAGLDWLKKEMRPRDVAVVFISSHGGYDGMGFFGVQPAGYREHHKQQTAVWGEEIREDLLETPGRKVVLMETCNSGTFLKTPVKIEPLPGTLIITSCRVKESSGASMGYAAIKALSGAAAGPNGVVTSDRMVQYLRRQVPRATSGKQHIMANRPKDMPPIALTRG